VQVAQLESSLQRWQGLAEGSPQRYKLREEIETNAESATLALHELERLAINPVEKDPAKFGLDASEVAGRRQWHAQTRDRVARVQGVLAAAAKAAADKAAAKGGGRGGPMRNLQDNVYVKENDRLLDDEHSRQQVIMRKQDKELEDIGQHVVRIGEMGKTIGKELDDQAELISDLDRETDTVRSRLEAATRKISQVINKSSSKTQFYLIVFLVVLLFLLLFLAFW
jgi:syntaxin of plants SYP6